MSNFLSRLFPPKEEILKMFWVALVGANFMAFIGFAYYVNAFILKYTLAEILIIFAYAQSYSLFEVSFVLILLMLLSAILPAKWFRDQFSSNGALLYIIATIYLYPWFGYTSGQGLNNFYIYANVITHKKLFIIFWSFIFVSIFYLSLRIFRNKTNRLRLDHFIERVRILGYFYAVSHFFSLIIIIWRLFI